MKLYKAILTYETVIRAKSHEDARWEANYTISQGDETPVNVEISEITTSEDLAVEWDEDSRPWGETDPLDRTIGEIIRDQNKKNEIKNEKEMTPQDKLISDAGNAMTGKGEREGLFDEREHAFFAGYIEAIKDSENKKKSNPCAEELVRVLPTTAQKEYKIKPYYYVYLIDGQAPQKAHPTLESAHQEAIRLALMYPDARIEILKCLGFAKSKSVKVTWAEENEGTNNKTEDLKAEVAALRGQMQDNPWCKSCREADCSVRSDGTCSMIRKYISAYNPPTAERTCSDS